MAHGSGVSGNAHDPVAVGNRFAIHMHGDESMGMDKVIEKKKWPLKRIVKYGSIAAAGLVMLVMLLSTSESTLNVKQERITISTVELGPFQEDIPIIGNILPIDTRYLDTTEGGVVERIYVENGTMVKKGDKILTLSNTNLLINIMRSEAEVNRAANDLRSTRLALEQNRLRLENQLAEVDYELQRKKRDYERKEVLHNERLISKQEFEEAKDLYFYLEKKRDLTEESHTKELKFQESQIGQLEKSLRRMQENLSMVKKRQENLTIRAPIDGLLTSFEAEIGESKPAGERIGKVDVVEGFKVRAEIDEHYLNRVKAEQTGTFEFAGGHFDLVVSKVFQEVKDGKFEVDLNFQGQEPLGIRRGQTLHIKLALSDVKEALLLSRGGFYQTSGGNWVYVIDSSGEFATRRDIRINRQNTRYFEVMEGLEPGEKVITSSYENFRDMEKLVLQ
jgi:HlyD family secretion protein